jgi:hypothetical protein
MKQIGTVGTAQIQTARLTQNDWNYGACLKQPRDGIHIDHYGASYSTAEDLVTDVHFDSSPEASVDLLINFQANYTHLRRHFGQAQVPWASMGENLIIQELLANSSPWEFNDLTGTELTVVNHTSGEHILTLSAFSVCEPCEALARFIDPDAGRARLRSVLAQLRGGRRGFLAKVTGSGVVRRGDLVFQR